MEQLFDIEKSKELVKRLQNKKISYREERLLLSEIEARYIPHTHDNYLYDPDDMKSEYIMATWNALYRAKLNVGDPIAFACNRGRGAILDYYRKISSERLILYCPSCNIEYTYDRRNIFCKNPNCEYYQQEDQLKSKEKEELVPIEEFDNNFSVNALYLDRLIIDEIFNSIVNYVKESKRLTSPEKSMIIKAIEYKQDFYDYARSTGKSHSFSIAFKKRMTKFLQSAQELFNIS